MRIGLTVLLAGLLAAAPALAQEAPSARERGESAAERMAHRGHGPLEMLMEHRERLALTQEQIASLRAIEQRTAEMNQPLLQRMMQIRETALQEREKLEPPLTRDQRREMMSHMRQARPLLRQVRENSREAMREVGQVLNDAQKTALREIVAERREQMRERRGEVRERRGEMRDRHRGVRHHRQEMRDSTDRVRKMNESDPAAAGSGRF